MADETLLGWIALAAVVAGAVGLVVGVVMSQQRPPVESFKAMQELPAMTNSEVITWRDRKGRPHVMEVHRRVEMTGSE